MSYSMGGLDRSGSDDAIRSWIDLKDTTDWPVTTTGSGIDDEDDVARTQVSTRLQPYSAFDEVGNVFSQPPVPELRDN